MTIKQYFPISVVVLIGLIALVSYLGAPVAPFAIVLLATETLIGFQLEDHRVPKLLHEIFRAPKHRQQ